MFISVVSKQGFFCSSPEEGATGRSPDQSATCDGSVATREGPRCPLQMGACELELELGEVEEVCEAEELEDDANLGEPVWVQVRRHFYIYPMFNSALPDQFIVDQLCMFGPFSDEDSGRETCMNPVLSLRSITRSQGGYVTAAICFFLAK